MHELCSVVRCLVSNLSSLSFSTQLGDNVRLSAQHRGTLGNTHVVVSFGMGSHKSIVYGRSQICNAKEYVCALAADKHDNVYMQVPDVVLCLQLLTVIT